MRLGREPSRRGPAASSRARPTPPEVRFFRASTHEVDRWRSVRSPPLSGAAVAAAAEPVPTDRAGGRRRQADRAPGQTGCATSIQAQQELERLRDAYRHSADQASARRHRRRATRRRRALAGAARARDGSACATGSTKAETSSTVAGVPRATLESIAACESGGDPTAVSSDGTYRGKYQFDRGTWASVGGSGDPAAAPEAEQDYRAALLYSRSSSSPWPVCG